jgi:shikimate kinase
VIDRPCRVVLLGMMGSGKTTLGLALAARTGWAYHDNDRLVIEATGRTARELLAEGYAALRDAETRALLAGLDLPPPAIIGAAAGVVLDDGARRVIATRGLGVWLRAAPEVLAARAIGGAHRPWLDDDPAGWMERAAAERAPLYRSVADREVDTGGAGPSELATEVVAWLRGTACARWLA